MEFVYRLTGISHPLISSLHMRKNLGMSHSDHQNVLVIETKFPDDDENPMSFDDYLIELLTDLEDLKDQAEERTGKLDHIDIKL